MSQFFHIHPINPQQRLVNEAVKVLRAGGVIIYPTDSTYALGCLPTATDAIQRIRLIRQLDQKHYFTLMCRDLSDISTYAFVDNPTFRLLKKLIPGPYTFILKATKEVPKRLQHPKRKTVGIRVPDCTITQELLKALQEPLLSCTLKIPQQNQPQPLIDPEEIYQLFHHLVDLIIDGGTGPIDPTSVIDCSQAPPQVIRQGLGDTSDFN